MKKSLVILFLFASSLCFSQAGVATASLQSAGNNTLVSIKGALFSSGVPITDWIVSVDSKLNSLINQGALTQPNVYTLTVSSSTASSSGTVSAGYKSVGIFTSSTFSGSINGVARNPNTFYSFSTPQTNAVLSAIIYVISAGSITIDKIQ